MSVYSYSDVRNSTFDIYSLKARNYWATPSASLFKHQSNGTQDEIMPPVNQIDVSKPKMEGKPLLDTNITPVDI